MRVAFIIGRFPVVSETFIINQIADLIDRGVNVEVFAYERGGADCISSKYEAYRMAAITHYLRAPDSKLARLRAAIPIGLKLLFTSPRLLVRSINIIKYPREALSLQLLFSVIPFIGKRFDIIHCHFGTIAVAFLPTRDALRLNTPIITTFYGYDVSAAVKDSKVDYYNRLKQECDLFLVMSDNMKQRLLKQGFQEEKVKVHPVSIDVDSYPFRERKSDPNGPVELIFVGRLVEKKGCDDLLYALVKVRDRTGRAFRCSIIGAGPLDAELNRLATTLGLLDIVDFKGAMQIDDIILMLLDKHIIISPSKTAKNGDIE